MKRMSRRDFLRCVASAGVLRAAAPFGMQLAGIGAAAATQNPQDYRALVCVFMFGGNDSYNTILPFDKSEFDVYRNIRPEIALPLESLLEIRPENASGRRFALHPALAPMQKLFGNGTAAIVANVGPLVVPIQDAAAFRQPSVPRPPKLFSHNDQQAVWQSFSPEGAKIGWGGRMGDLWAEQNGNHMFTAISTSGNALLLASEKTRQYQISVRGAIGINRLGAQSLFGSGMAAEALRAQIAATHNHAFQQEYGAVVERSVEAHGLIAAALDTLPETDPRVALPQELTQDRLAQQLRVVARMIGVRAHENLRMKRQIFFVSLGGFDTHDDQLEKQAELLASFARSVAYFQESMSRLDVADSVTLFTASDFGRTLTSNGDGSDHGWGGHHFIVGGAVNGGRIYGHFPDIALNTATEVGNGRLLPTTAVDQYVATLGRWMGVSENDLSLLLPNLSNFTPRNLGFLT
jgi:uncharacterized protein (DUF1501 family)